MEKGWLSRAGPGMKSSKQNFSFHLRPESFGGRVASILLGGGRVGFGK